MYCRFKGKHSFSIMFLAILVMCVPTSMAALESSKPSGPFESDWESIEKNFRIPQWFLDGKFGIFMHWGVFSVPAHASEWYPK